MTAQTSGEAFRVRGEKAPVWLPWGLILIGLVGSIVAAWLVLPDPSDGYDLVSREATMGSTQEHPPVAEAALGETPDASSLAEEPEATLGKENNRQPTVTDTGFGAERIPATISTPDAPASDTSADGLEPVVSSAMNGSAAQLARMHDLSKQQVSIQQLGPGVTPKSGEGALGPVATNATAAETEASPATPVQGDPGKSSFQSTQSEVQGGATSEQPVDETAGDCAPLFSVRFEHGGIEPQGRHVNENIKRLAAWLSAHPTAIIYADGYADSSGPEETNLFISFRRAAAVAALLKDAGASDAQLVVRAYGESQSLSSSAGSEPDRRVALKIDTYMSCDVRAPKGGGLR